MLPGRCRGKPQNLPSAEAMMFRLSSVQWFRYHMHFSKVSSSVFIFSAIWPRSDRGTRPRRAAGHNGVKLSREEMDKLCCWIDLLVPYCGDYTEANAWNQDEKQKYARYFAKRQQMAARERANIKAMLSGIH